MKEVISKSKMYTTSEFAKLIKVKRATINHWMCTGRLKIRPGRDYIKLGSGRGSTILFKEDFVKRFTNNPNKYLISHKDK